MPLYVHMIPGGNGSSLGWLSSALYHQGLRSITVALLLSPGLLVDLCPYGPPWAAGAQLSHPGLHLGLQGNLCSAPGAAAAPPSSLTGCPQSCCFLLFSLWLKFLLWSSCLSPQYIIPNMAPPLPVGWALASSLELAGIGSIKPGRGFQQLLIGATCRTPPPKVLCKRSFQLWSLICQSPLSHQRQWASLEYVFKWYF